jgi:hypothetical protein
MRAGSRTGSPTISTRTAVDASCVDHSAGELLDCAAAEHRSYATVDQSSRLRLLERVPSHARPRHGQPSAGGRSALASEVLVADVRDPAFLQGRTEAINDRRHPLNAVRRPLDDTVNSALLRRRHKGLMPGDAIALTRSRSTASQDTSSS